MFTKAGRMNESYLGVIVSVDGQRLLGISINRRTEVEGPDQVHGVQHLHKSRQSIPSMRAWTRITYQAIVSQVHTRAEATTTAEGHVGATIRIVHPSLGTKFVE